MSSQWTNTFVVAAMTIMAAGPAWAQQLKEDKMPSIKSEIRALYDRQAEAIRTKDLDRLMSVYARDVTYFDTVAPLQFAGSAALRARFSEWFRGFSGPIDLEARDLQLIASADVAVTHWFSRARGTLKNGRQVGSWVRVTSVSQRLDGQWVVIHEHVSWPVDPASRNAAMNLEPPAAKADTSGKAKKARQPARKDRP